MTLNALRKVTALLAVALTSVFFASAPALAGPAGGLATTVQQLNADLRGKGVTQIRKRRGFRGRRGFRRGFRRGRRFGRLRRGRVRGFRRGRHIRRHAGRRYRHRKYRRYRRYRPRIYYSVPYVSYGYRSSCYKPCRWDGYSRRYCRRYCRRHGYYY
ncbi:MAG: hypothetical protein RIC14_12370 [Filomicrobium sp.]